VSQRFTIVLLFLLTVVACSGAKSTEITSPADGGTGTGTGTANGSGPGAGPAGTITPACPPGSAPCDKRDCSNSSCECKERTQCDLSCASPPCHVKCEERSACSATCSNGNCKCEKEASCSFACGSGPCHVDCGEGSTCNGVCSNGNCRCEKGASCAFTCTSGPCHVTCDKDNPRCNGVCSNGNCVCGEGSTCNFTCQGAPCHVQCKKGSKCLVNCAAGAKANDPAGCIIDTCEDGQPVTCPNGTTIACGTPCP
jgi:hypothetical protein